MGASACKIALFDCDRLLQITTKVLALMRPLMMGVYRYLLTTIFLHFNRRLSTSLFLVICKPL
jgi:hypothetical protein